MIKKISIMFLLLIVSIFTVSAGTITDNSGGINFFSSVGITYNGNNVCVDGVTTSYDFAGSTFNGISNLNKNYYVDDWDNDINNIIDLAYNSGGGNIYVVSGNYNITETAILKPNVNLYSLGSTNLFLNSVHNLVVSEYGTWDIKPIIYVNNSNNNIISGFNIDGNGINQALPPIPESGYVGVYVFNSSNIKVLNNILHNLGTNKTAVRGWGVMTTYSEYINIDGNTAYENGYEGFGIRTGTYFSIVNNNVGYNNNVHCIQTAGGGNIDHVYNPKYITISNNICGNVSGDLKDNSKILTHSSDNINIINNIAPRIQILENASDIIIDGNTININDYDYSTSYGIEVSAIGGADTSQIERIIITNNNINNDFNDSDIVPNGITLESYDANNYIDSVVISNNIIKHGVNAILFDADSGINSIRNIVVSNNIIESNNPSSYSAFTFANNISYNIIFKNNIINNENYIFRSLTNGDFSNISIVNNNFNNAGAIITGLDTTEIKESLENIGYSYEILNIGDSIFRDDKIGIGGISSRKVAIKVNNDDGLELYDSGSDTVRATLKTFITGGGAFELMNSTGSLKAKIRGYSSSGIQAYFIAGNIGIGTDNPTALLDVDGLANNGVIEINGGGGGCLKIRDTDDGGFTYCNTLDGALNCSITSCE